VDRKKDPDDPMGPLFHMVRVYLIDREAMIRNIYSFGMLDPRLLLADVRTLLQEEGNKADL
jgi:cytochrome oxidase Cu insertion factor (SCO1/SenC/PrrC family)